MVQYLKRWYSAWTVTFKHIKGDRERKRKIEDIKLRQNFPAPLPCLLGKHERFIVPDDLINSYCMGCGHHLKPRTLHNPNGIYMPLDSEWVTDKEYALLSRRK